MYIFNCAYANRSIEVLELDTVRSIQQDLSKILLFLFGKVYDSRENEGG